MADILKVTPEKLIETAGEFANTEANIRSLTTEMTAIVDSFKPIWQGEAATGFANRFAALSDDLTEMAEEYRMAESQSGDLAAGLVTEAVS